jgi:competence protein ComEC
VRKRPFFFLACIFTIGVLVGNTKNWLFLMPVVLLYGYAMPWKEKGARRVLFAVGLPLLFLLGVLRTHDMISVREASMSQIIEGQELCLAGKVVRIESKTRCFYYYLTDCYVSLSGERVKCQDVIAYIPTDAYSIGQILVIQGTSSFFAPAANEGGFDAQQFYQSQRIDFAIEADEITAVADSGSRYREALYRLRKRLQQVLEASVEDEGVLSAIFWQSPDFMCLCLVWDCIGCYGVGCARHISLRRWEPEHS